MKTYAQARQALTNSLRPLPGAFDRPRLAGMCRHPRVPIRRCLASSPLYEPALDRLSHLGVAEAGGWIADDHRERQPQSPAPPWSPASDNHARLYSPDPVQSVELGCRTKASSSSMAMSLPF